MGMYDVVSWEHTKTEAFEKIGVTQSDLLETEAWRRLMH